MWNAETNIKGPAGPPGPTINPATATPLVESGTGAVGTSAKYAREDHVHPLGPGGGGSSVLVSDTPPVGAPDKSLWWESDTGNLYIRYNDGDSTQWVLAVPGTSAASISAVTYLPQTLTAPQQTVARQNIYAAPFDALAYSGMQINGSMEVAQASAGTTTNDTYAIDGWKLNFSGAMAVSASTYVDAALVPGIPNQLYISVQTASASVGATDFVCLTHKIEGYRTARLGWGTPGPQPITIAFWSSHIRVGTYSVGVRNGANNRSYVATYTQSVSGVPEYKTITIPGTNEGPWPFDNTTSMSLSFVMACGSSLIGTANAWVVANVIAAPGQVNGVAATSDAFRITGVVVLPGIEAPSAARSPLIMRPYDQELATCRRYFNKMVFPVNCSISTLMAYSTTAAYGPIATFAEMRSSPTFGLSSGFNLQGAGTGGIALTGTTNASSPTGVYAAPFNTAGSLIAGSAVNLISVAANSYFTFDARL